MTVVSSVDDEVIADLAPRGVLRAAINLGNPVLAQGTASAPAGVTADIARELAARFGVAADLTCFGAAPESFEAMARGDADICFLAIFIEELKASGFIGDALRRSGQDGALVAPPGAVS